MSDGDKKIRQHVHDFVNDLRKSDKFDTNSIHRQKERYAAFIYMFATKVVSATRFKTMRDDDPTDFENVVTIADEGLMIIILENNLARWKAEGEIRLKHCGEDTDKTNLIDIKVPKKDLNDLPLSLYTMGKENDSNLRAGWNKKGTDKFKHHVVKIHKFRGTPEFREFYKYAMEITTMKKKGSKRRRSEESVQQSGDEHQNDDDDGFVLDLSEYASITKFHV